MLTTANITFILVVVGFIGGAVYVTSQAFNGRRQNRLNSITEAEGTIKLLKDRIDAQDSRIDDLEESLSQEHDKVVQLTEQIKLKDETIKSYLDILQNRDPELKNLLKDLKTAMDALVTTYQQNPTTKVVVTNTPNP